MKKHDKSVGSVEKHNNLYRTIREIIDNARGNISRSVNQEMVKACWLIGKAIVKEEQKGVIRAGYGKNLIDTLSKKLTLEFGAGWSSSHLWHVKQFYLSNKILHALRAELSWTHYRSLMRVDNVIARKFYEIECAKSRWSTRELERQIGSFLYERLALSKDKKAVLKMVAKGQEISKYSDIIKDPYVL
ncbi:MAG: DUF1016 N-terminal domain-containing protein, partial [Candidatus Margulisiibacteriota bacterium]